MLSTPTRRRDASHYLLRDGLRQFVPFATVGIAAVAWLLFAVVESNASAPTACPDNPQCSTFDMDGNSGNFQITLLGGMGVPENGNTRFTWEVCANINPNEIPPCTAGTPKDLSHFTISLGNLVSDCPGDGFQNVVDTTPAHVIGDPTCVNDLPGDNSALIKFCDCEEDGLMIDPQDGLCPEQDGPPEIICTDVEVLKGECKQFSILLQGTVPTGIFPVGFKAGNPCPLTNVLGPACTQCGDDTPTGG